MVLAERAVFPFSPQAKISGAIERDGLNERRTIWVCLKILAKSSSLEYWVAPPVPFRYSQFEHGTDAVEGTIDVARQIVKIGTDVYRAIPPEAFALSGDPLHGLLKHEAQDEIILLGEIAGNAAIFSALSWPALGPVGASLAIAQGAVPLYVTVGSLVGKLHHRLTE